MSHRAKELVVNSGPRYRLSGWPFWTKVFGEHVGEIPDYYGEGFEARVWRKDLSQGAE